MPSLGGRVQSKLFWKCAWLLWKAEKNDLEKLTSWSYFENEFKSSSQYQNAMVGLLFYKKFYFGCILEKL